MNDADNMTNSTDLDEPHLPLHHQLAQCWRTWLSGPLIAVAIGWLVILALLAIFADVLPIHDPLKQNYTALNGDPSFKHPFGNDSLGRDIFARVIHGARVSMVVAVASPLLGLCFGLVLGMLAGYFQGRIDTMLGVFTDTMIAFPNLVLATVVVAFAGGTLPVMVAVIAFYTLPRYIRVARANTLLFRNREFVMAARAQGASDLRILVKEILPNLVAPMATLTLTLMSFAILIEGGLSFLGIGIPGPRPTWGRMISEGINDLPIDPKISLIPAAVICLTILALNLIGDRIQSKTGSKAASI